MIINALIAQYPISFSIQENLETTLEILTEANPGNLVLLSEGALSGYSHDLTFLDRIDQKTLQDALETLQNEAITRRLHLWLGACIREGGKWYNAAYGFTPAGERHIYYKINLATHERGTFTPGDRLPIFELKTSEWEARVGVQLCRELRYPEQWGWLARQGTQLFLHLNNAISNSSYLPVWRSHLVSRAAETQRFVLSANNAAPEQVSPTIAIAPNGFILDEIVSEEKCILKVAIDLSQVSDFYLSQAQDDVVSFRSDNEG